LIKELIEILNKERIFTGEDYKQFSDELDKYSDEKLKELIEGQLKSFNYQRLEYLGDSLVNFVLAKQFYIDTIEKQESWYD
jgi:hypothetical protein